MRKRTLLAAAGIVAAVILGATLAPSAPPEAKAPPWELAKAKVEAARKACDAIEAEYSEGKATQDQVHAWSNRMRAAQQEASAKKADHLAAVEGHLERMKRMEMIAQSRFLAKRVPPSEVAGAEYYRADAELQLSKAKSSR